MDNVAIKTLLAELDAQGIFVYLQDGRLKLRSKLTTVPAPELAKIKACKDELIAYMQRHHLQQGDLSSAQQRIWFIDQYEQQSTAYNMCGLLQLSDSLTINELQRAFDTLLARHQILTTQFFNTDQGVVQRVNSQLRLALNALEIARHETPTQIVEKLHDELSYRFDLENDLLIRATLIGHSGEGKWLYIAMHHIIADGWSVRLLVQELLAILTNNNNTVNNAAACKPLQYLDYVHWQGQFKQSPIYQQQLSYWQQALTGMELFELPTSYPRDKQKTYQGKSQHSVIETRLVTEFDSCCQQLSATRFVGLLSVFYVLLQRYSQKQDITVAVPVLNREQPEFENVIGCFINTLPMRQMVSPQSSFAQLIAQTKVLVAQGLANQSVAVEDIIETLGLAKSSAHSALFQILFNYNGVDTGTVETATLSAKLLPLDNGTAKFDLTLNVSESEQGLDISFDYCSALFDDHVIQQMSNDFNELVISLGNNAAQTIATVELPSACYASQLLGRKKDHEKVSSDVIALPVQVIKQAELSAEKTACIEADQHGKTARSLSYQQLVQQSAALASHILALQTHHQQTTAAPIALLVSRSIDALLTMFALLQTGRAYLPIEQGTPVARIAEILQQAGCEYLVTFDDTALEKQAVTVLNEQHITLWPFAQLSKAAVNLTGLPNLNLNDSAYVIFTSGSTGAPKGVEINHAALAHYVQSITKRLELNNDTKSAVVTGLATDLCLTGIYPVWASGGTVVLISPHVKSDPVAIVDTFSEQAINFLKITPSFAAELLATIAASQVPRAPLQQWVLGGESLTAQLVAQIRALYPSAKLINHYGPTETCIGVATYEIEDHQTAEQMSYPIGSALAHVELAILDAHHEPVAMGMPGQLYIGGESLATGYIRATDQTAKSFVVINTTKGQQRYYCSGDNVRLRKDGALEYLGRLDKQPKIRGFRVDLLDIEAKLTALSVVKNSAVICREIASADTLVAYYVASNEGQQLTAEALQQRIKTDLKCVLPEPMIPSFFVLKEQLPYLENGKVDRKFLQQQMVRSSDTFVAPKTLMQQQVAALFAQLTGFARVGLEDDFFAIGGHSLLAIRLLNQIRQQFGVSLSLKDIFNHATVEELAQYLTCSEQASSKVQLTHIDLAGEHPLSFSQRRIWFVDQLQGHSRQYNLQGVFTLRGDVDVVALQQAFKDIIKRHTILSYNYKSTADAQPCQYFNGHLAFSLQQIDLCTQADQQQLLQKMIVEDYNQSFDLTSQLMLRASLIKIADHHYQLLVTVHHIVADGWSIGLICRELASNYNQHIGMTNATDLQTLEHNYIDFVHWQHSMQADPQWQISIDYWRQQLAQLPTVHELPTQYERGNDVLSGGGLYKTVLSPALTEQLRLFIANQGDTLFVTLQTVFTLWFSRVSGQSDCVLGTPVAGRVAAELEPIIGNFVNTLVLRNKVSGDTCFNQALADVKATLSEALLHQQIPFDLLVDELATERSLAIPPLVQVIFRVNNTINENLQLAGLSIKASQSKVRSAKLDLEVSVIDTGDVLEIEWLYDTALWHQANIETFFAQFSYVLQQCLADQSVKLAELMLWSPSQHAAALSHSDSIDIQNTQPSPLHVCFSHFAKQHPQHPAVRCNGQTYSYLALEQRANQLAHCLLEMDFAAQSRIAILLPSGAAMVVAILAILKARHVYVPIHQDTPIKTLSYIVEDAELMMILALSENADTLINSGADFLLVDDLLDDDSNFDGYPVEQPDEQLSLNVKDDDLSYIIYTSGSTGRPKGVMINHANLAAYLQHAVAHYMPDNSALCSSVLSTPLAFDATITSLYPALMQGGVVEIIAQGGEQLTQLTELLFTATDAKLFKLTPAHLRAILALSQHYCVSNVTHTLVIGGEALTTELLLAIRAKLPLCRWINEYGPTETTVGSSTFVIDHSTSDEVLLRHNDVPIGLANDNVTLLVVDQFDQPAAVNMRGELLIAGPVVSPGYINQTELNNTSFITLQLPSQQGGKVTKRFYRTGDIALWQADETGAACYLRYCGRKDQQIKLRGFRVDLAAIEQLILELPEVADCAVTVDSKQQTLAAHIVYHQHEKPLAVNTIKSHLSHYLAPYMIPAHCYAITVMPLTKNGKIDKATLIADALNCLQPTSTTHSKHAQTPLQQYLLQLFSEILLTTHIGLDDNFFDLGGHSLLAIRLIGKIREGKQLDITLPQLFKTPTIATLAQALQNCEKIQPHQEIVKISRQQALPLSYAQQRLWLIDQVHNESVQYHMPASFVFTGKLELTALSGALYALIERHEVLRTVIITRDQGSAPEQCINEHFEIPLELHDLSMLNREQQDHQWQSLSSHASSKAFDLASDVLLRVVVAKISNEQSFVHFNMHHIASDGWSMAILVREFIAFYRAASAEPRFVLPALLQQPLAIQYADFAYWQRLVCSESALHESLSYWRTQLTGAPFVHQLPIEQPRAIQQQLQGQCFNQHLSAATTKAIHQQCATHGVTLYMWLHTTFSLLMMRLSEATDILVGSPVAGREQPQIANLIGFFVNTLVIRTRSEGQQNFTQLLMQQKQVILDAFKHQQVPFEQLVEVLQPERNLAHHPLFQILFALQNNETSDFSLPGLHIEMQPHAAPKMKFDLEVNAIEQGDGIELQWNFSETLFNASSITEYAAAFEVLIDAILSDPLMKLQLLPVVSATKENVLLNLSSPPYARHTQPLNLVTQIARQAEQYPTRNAVVGPDGEVLSYVELQTQSQLLANYLQEQGITAGSKVALCVSATAQMLVAMLAILKTGSAYVPIDPKLPVSRVQFIIDDSKAQCLITQSAFAKQHLTDELGSLIAPLCVLLDEPNSWQYGSLNGSQSALPASYSADDLAYIIYTSGTTGTPKGVMISHGNLACYLAHAQCEYLSAALTTSVVSTPLAFDATVTSLWAPLLMGINITLLADDEQMLEQLAKQIFSSQACLFKVTPAHLQGLLAFAPAAAVATAHVVVIGGEALPTQLLKSLTQYLPNCQWVNEYGPTEATVGCSVYHCELKQISELERRKMAQVPIGRAIADSQLVILDEHQQLTAMGAIGELYIAGDNVAQGYLNQASLTAQSFVWLPFGHQQTVQRFYRTGDKVRWLLDKHGQPEHLLFCARVDEQIKLRGYRIEPGEITAQLVQHKEISEACVILNKDTENLEAYLVLTPNNSLIKAFGKEQQITLLGAQQQAMLSNYLTNYLPAYMMPTKWHAISAIPLTSNAKVDSKQLLQWGQSVAVATENVPPRNDFEAALVDIFAEQLQVDSVGITDNFFALGGHSLLATQCMALLKARLQADIPVRVLFERPTIAAIASWYAIHQAANNAMSENDNSEEMFL